MKPWKTNGEGRGGEGRGGEGKERNQDYEERNRASVTLVNFEYFWLTFL